MENGGPSFERDIKPLFRAEDRIEMEWAFDLWSYDEVKEHGRSILARLEDGTMPCDAPWGPEKIQLMRDWIEKGCPA